MPLATRLHIPCEYQAVESLLTFKEMCACVFLLKNFASLSREGCFKCVYPCLSH